MVRLAGGAARSHEFHPNSLQVSLAEIARRSYGDGSTVNQALEERVYHATDDGIVTQSEESRLREFRNRLALDAGTADQKAKRQAFKTGDGRFAYNLTLNLAQKL